ncbi:MAG: TIGR02147 family protein [Chitinivibrionales bacterium]|nr:TIGR02147 family protein [Chitinivibrionales bacterium]MBD3358530.1 TIGR02147 family protein [Chitinivibrionales bacterium]
MKRIQFYDDFRHYLSDYYADAKRRFPHFSHRYFARKAGLTSPSHFRDVMEGRRRLTGKTIEKFIKGLGLTEFDARYFSALVRFNQGRTSVEKQQALEQMRGLKQKVRQYRLPIDLYDYYSCWYRVALRELACLVDWKDDYKLIARSLTPPIKPGEARESIAFLLDKGFLKKTNDGRYVQTEPAITSGAEVSSLAVRTYNAFMSERAREAIDRFPPSERDIQSLTVGISPQAYGQIKQEMQEFISRVVRIVDDDVGSERVYNMNLQLFPLSRNPEETDNDS